MVLKGLIRAETRAYVKYLAENEKISTRENVEKTSISRATVYRIKAAKAGKKSITRNMGQDGDGHAHFDPIWRPNITINYMGVDQNIKF
jgi:hypothetical protein